MKKLFIVLAVLVAAVLVIAQSKFPNTVVAPTFRHTNGPATIGQVLTATATDGSMAWSNSAGGGSVSAGRNIEVSGSTVSTTTNLLFLDGAGYDRRLGLFIDDAGGATTGTGTNFGFYDVTGDALSLWTHGTGLDWRFADDVFLPAMDQGDGTQTNVVVWSNDGQLRRTSRLSLTELFVNYLNISNSIFIPWQNGQVLWASNNWLVVNDLFYWDWAEATLKVPAIETGNVTVQSNFVFSGQSPAFGKVLTASSGSGGSTWAYPERIYSFINSNAATYQVDFSDGTNGMFSTDVMRADLTLQLTNLIVGAKKSLYLTGDTNANNRTVTVSTNGNTLLTAIRWNLNCPTNGNSDFVVTNNQRVELSFIVTTNQVGRRDVWAVYGHVR